MSEVQAKAWLENIIAEAAGKAVRLFGLSSQEEGRRKLYEGLRSALAHGDDQVIAAVRASK